MLPQNPLTLLPTKRQLEERAERVDPRHLARDRKRNSRPPRDTRSLPKHFNKPRGC